MSFEDTRVALRVAIGIAFLSALTVGGAWLFQLEGYQPCELCLKGRIPHYAGVALALVTAALVIAGRAKPLAVGFGGLALIYAAGCLFSLYHAGVEWHWWPGPSSCTGSGAGPQDVGSLLEQLKTVTLVRCDAAAIHILGLSLAVWNALICGALALAAAYALRAIAPGARLTAR